VAGALVLVALSDVIVTTVYGPSFAAAAPLLRLFALALPIHAFNGALGQALQSAGQQRAMAWIVTSGLALHVVLTAFLVPALGIGGAAVAMIVSSSVVALGALRTLHSRVAAISLTARAIPAILAVLGPLALVMAAPAPLRLATAGVGLAWLVAGALWHGIFVPADIADVRAAFRTSGSAATA
jgi:O-antigen/teichoic acid export membrane protein